MLKYYLTPITVILILISFFACDHGLAPPTGDQANISGISGIITYENWPADSLYDLRLTIFKNYPPEDILTEVIYGRATVYPGLSSPGLETYVNRTEFIVELSPGIYEYVAVAQQYGENVGTDWRAVGQYDTLTADDLPTVITVNADQLLENINIHVDFDNLPPQPF